MKRGNLAKTILRFSMCLCLVFIGSIHANALTQAEVEYASYLSETFLNEAERHRTSWKEEDADRYAQSLIETLNSYRSGLGDSNYEIIFSYLPKHVQEMAKTVIIVTLGSDETIVAPSPFIDSFLADFEGRIKTLAERGGPIYPDENSRLVIKAQITEIVENALEALEGHPTFESEDLEFLKEKIILYFYRSADHPLRSQFKRVPSQEEISSLKVQINNDLANMDETRINERVKNSSRIISKDEERRLKYSVLKGHIEKVFTKEWRLGTLLRSNQEARQFSDEANAVLDEQIKLLKSQQQ